MLGEIGIVTNSAMTLVRPPEGHYAMTAEFKLLQIVHDRVAEEHVAVLVSFPIGTDEQSFNEARLL